MQLDLDDDETRALLKVLMDAIEADGYPLSPRVRVLKDILAKFGDIGGLSPEVTQRLAPLYLAPTYAPATSESVRTAEPGQIQTAVNEAKNQPASG